ncbi:MAG: hypothetical protein NTZ17_05005 [Phycisphaerae bacterium]|nr:hypothetical protein [Phycisphaerae bacterium]
MSKTGYLRMVTTMCGVLGALWSGGQAAKADFTIGKAQNLGQIVNSASSVAGCCLSADALELYFGSNQPGGSGNSDIWVSTRQSTDAPWGPPANLGPPVNTQYVERSPSLSSDGLTLYFSENYPSTSPFRPGGVGGTDMWMATRTSRNDPWTVPVNLGAPINSAGADFSPTTSGDGLILIFTSSRTGGSGGLDLWMSVRATVRDPWGVPVSVGVGVNSPSHELEPALSANGLALVFCSDRGPNIGSFDLWMTTRKSRQDPWSPPVNLGPMVNSIGEDGSPAFAPDMRTLYFDSNRQGGFGDYDLYEAPIIPIVDFNGDGKVDLVDLVMLIDNWGTNKTLCDIGPVPWGDGQVDEKDLEVLMSYWRQQINDPTLIACWELDEVSGMVAADSAGTNNGTLVGGILGSHLHISHFLPIHPSLWTRVPSASPRDYLVIMGVQRQKRKEESWKQRITPITRVFVLFVAKKNLDSCPFGFLISDNHSYRSTTIRITGCG